MVEYFRIFVLDVKRTGQGQGDLSLIATDRLTRLVSV